MNPSRSSYSCPMDLSNEYSEDVILHQCEFCKRTFIPDSLAKHRKVCYRNYLKERSKLSRKASSGSRPRSSKDMSGDIPQSMQLNELMFKRQIRRMNWRKRHEEFIQTIRTAREYAIAVTAGISVTPQLTSTTSLDIEENMKRCRYCLRKFQKNAFDKHITRCKEHFIQNLKSRPNDAQMEAKRRLSLRLYYKPRSFRGDSPDEQTSSYMSDDIDIPSCISNISSKLFSEQSKATARSIHSANPLSKSKTSKCHSLHRDASKSQNKSDRANTATVSSGNFRTRSTNRSPSGSSTIMPQKITSRITNDLSTVIPMITDVTSTKSNAVASHSNLNNSIYNNYDSREQLTKIKNKSSKIKRSKTITSRPEEIKGFDNKNSSNSHTRNEPVRTVKPQAHSRSKSFASKMKDISNLLKNNESDFWTINNNRDVNSNDDLHHNSINDIRGSGGSNKVPQLVMPKINPAESLREAKQVLKFLEQRILTNSQQVASSLTNATDESLANGENSNLEQENQQHNNEFDSSNYYNNPEYTPTKTNQSEEETTGAKHRSQYSLKTVTTDPFNYKEVHPKALLGNSKNKLSNIRYDKRTSPAESPAPELMINPFLNSNMSNDIKTEDCKKSTETQPPVANQQLTTTVEVHNHNDSHNSIPTSNSTPINSNFNSALSISAPQVSLLRSNIQRTCLENINSHMKLPSPTTYSDYTKVFNTDMDTKSQGATSSTGSSHPDPEYARIWQMSKTIRPSKI